MRKNKNAIRVAAEIVILDAERVVLRVGGFEQALTPTQFFRAIHDPLPARSKRTPKAKSSDRSDASIPAPVDPRTERSARGKCAWCEGTPVKGKRLCRKHLAGARRAAAAAQETRAKNTRKRATREAHALN